MYISAKKIVAGSWNDSAMHTLEVLIRLSACKPEQFRRGGSCELITYCITFIGRWRLPQ
jgi:hypothetical protein